MSNVEHFVTQDGRMFGADARMNTTDHMDLRVTHMGQNADVQAKKNILHRFMFFTWIKNLRMPHAMKPRSGDDSSELKIAAPACVLETRNVDIP